MSKYIQIICLHTFLISTFLSQELHINFEQLNVENGLTNNTVNCILQDKLGFMWFGTENGLNKFDGNEFSTYLTIPGDSNTISDNFIFSICEDFLGNIWIGTANGLTLYDQGSEKFYQFTNIRKDSSSLPNNTVYSVITGIDSNLWIGTANGLALLAMNELKNIKNTFTPKFKVYKHNTINNESINSNNIRFLMEDRLGRLWISTWCEGINLFDKQKNLFLQFQVMRSDKTENWDKKIFMELPILCVSAFYLDPYDDNILWMSGSELLIKYNIVKKKYTAYQPDVKNLTIDILSIYKTPDKNIFLGTDRGLYLFDNIEEKFFNIFDNSNNQSAISSNIIQTIYEDNTGLIWLGTSGGGIVKLNLKRKNFNKHFSNINVKSIFEDCDDSTLWIGTLNDGLYQYDLITKNYKNFDVDSIKSPFSDIPTPGTIASIFQNTIASENIWLGVNAKGLVKFNKALNNFSLYNLLSPYAEFTIKSRDNLSLFSTLFIKDISSVNNNLWLAARFGLYEFNPQTEEFNSYKHDQNNINSIAQNDLTCLLTTDDNTIWIGTNGLGLDKFNVEKKSFTHITNDPYNPQSLSSNFIRCLLKDRNNILWVGTSVGLNKLDLKRYKDKGNNRYQFQRFYKKDGLASDKIHGILEDNSRNLWISSDKGLSKFNIEENTFQNFDKYDGLLSNEFNLNACLKNSKGELFFGGSNGMISFYPDNISYNTNIPKIIITEFQLFNQKVKPGENSPLKTTITETREITLNYDQSIFSFKFSALDYSSPNKNRYAYKMEGVDKNWVFTTASQRMASYTNLDPGEYKFKVIGSNNDGIWNEEGVSLSIIITPPWWKTKWAYYFYSLVFIILIVGSIRLEILRQKRKFEKKLMREKELRKLQEAEHKVKMAELHTRTMEAEKEMEKEQMRSRIASDLHDDVGSNLSSIALISNLLEQKPRAEKEYRRKLNDITNIARKTAEAMREIVWFVNPKNDDLQMLIAKMRETSNLMLDHLEYSFNIHEKNFSFQSDINFRRNLYLIYKEILQNIVKHSEAKKVSIDISKINGIFTMKIEDDGIGFNTQKKYRGSGLINLIKRSNEINGKLKIVSKKNFGTTIIIEIQIP